MRYAFILAGLATMAAGQALDINMIDVAPAPSATGPDVTDTVETIVYSAAALGSAAVTGTAAAAASSPVAKRGLLEARTFGSVSVLCKWFGWGCPAPAQQPTPTKAATTSAPTVPKTTPAVVVPTTTSAVVLPTSVTSINSAKPTPTGIPSSCTNTWTNTFEFTSATDCPQIYEVGTYCGFVNPEDPCADQPKGSGPVASPDTVQAFLSNPANAKTAQSAVAPKGYAQTFSNLQGATSAASYLGLQTLTSYDVAGCAAYCDKMDTCTSFNIYIERDPALNPSTEFCCPNPASITNYKCTLWGSIIDKTTATNTGQGRADFQVVITGSNGYTKADTTTPVTPPGCSKPQKCSAAHSHPSTCIGNHFFPGPYNPQLCASYAQAQNLKNGASTGRGYSANTCNFFNAYMLKKNGKPLGTYCSLFAQQYLSVDASYSIGLIGGQSWEVETSWSFNLGN